ncbi:MFS transporter [Dactylosporangium vinaceum]|uniref:MFS transporter n=1 Tax=Dactylosporangium vinaceum TaxID=53362 RepID=A0ABV5MD34_9ACTN|nr:MFS transporter [Dactylosporangium vinaceum]
MTFAALRYRGYRTYLIGQSLNNTGAWMGSVALDWLALRLTDSPAAVGVAMALQFLPILFLGVHGGALADRYRRRTLLLLTQSVNATLTVALAVLTIAGAIRIEHVFAFALLTGLVFVVDAPTRQVFATEVVPPEHLRAAVSLNAAVFQATRLVGPAIAALLIGTAGTGWVFAVQALCFTGPTIALLRLPATPVPPRTPREPGALRTAGRYVWRHPPVFWTILLVGVVGTFGLNFPIVLTALASDTFGGSASLYGLFNIVLAAGSAAGALLAGALSSARLPRIVLLGGLFGAVQALAALAPGLPVFLPLLAALGFVNLAFQALANASVQLWVDPAVRGRVMGLYMLVFTGGTPLGAPIIGALTDHFGARWGMAVCGLVPAAAAGAIAVLHRRPRPAVRARRSVPATTWTAPDARGAGGRAAVRGGGGRSARPVTSIAAGAATARDG